MPALLYRALHDGRPVFWCWRVLANSVTAQAGLRLISFIQNARSDRQTPLAVGSHRACEADARVRYVGNAFQKAIQKKTIGDVGCAKRNIPREKKSPRSWPRSGPPSLFRALARCCEPTLRPGTAAAHRLIPQPAVATPHAKPQAAVASLLGTTYLETHRPSVDRAGRLARADT